MATRRTTPGFVVWLAALILVLINSSFLAQAEEEEEGSLVEPADTRAEVIVAPVARGELRKTIRALGTIAYAPEIIRRVTAPVAGIGREIAIRPGDVVVAGSVLVRYDDRDALLAVKQAELALSLTDRQIELAENGGNASTLATLKATAETARQQATLLRAESDRVAALQSKGMASDKAVGDALAAASAAERDADLSEAKSKRYKGVEMNSLVADLKAQRGQSAATLEVARLALERTRILSPTSGSVESVFITAGQFVDQGTALVEIAPAAGKVINFSLPPRSAEQIAPGALARMEGEETTATVNVRSRMVGVESGMVELKAAPASPLTRLAGEVVRLDVETSQTAQGLLVPEAAVSYNEDTPVITVVRSGVAHVFPVEVLARNHGMVCVADSEILATDIVIVDGNANLPDGSGVVVKGEAE